MNNINNSELSLLSERLEKNKKRKNKHYGLSQIRNKTVCHLTLIQNDKTASEGESILKEKILKNVHC